MDGAPRGERLQIMLTQNELEELDNWRFARRMPSRAAAVRELLKRGLAADPLKGARPQSNQTPGGPCESDAGVSRGLGRNR